MKTDLCYKKLFWIVLATACLLATGCSSGIPDHQPNNTNQEVYSIATRKFPPEPVYNPVRWVRPPEVTPKREVKTAKAPLLMPVVHLNVKDASLSETAKILGTIGRYRSYCSNMVAQQKVTLNTLGTLDELGKQISRLTGAQVIIDHRHREIRIMANSFVVPEF